jgi:multiple sugar transport system ATP-binding protein/alpha-glucoside transport system ATP-binding protein
MAIGEQWLPLEGRWADDLTQVKPDQPLTSGIRPEAFQLAPSESANAAVHAVVEHVEYLGHETLAYVRVGQAADDRALRMVARLPDVHELAKGEAIHLQTEADRIHLFGEDGQALAS